jgi:hypothetical protein
MPSPASIVIMAAGVVMLLASFLAFYQYSGVFAGAGDFTAWSGDLFFPVTIIPVLFGVVMAAQVALTTFATNVKVPEKIAGFDWNQIHLVLGVQSAIMMLAFLVQDIGLLERGAGYWLMLLAAIALVVGAVLRVREPASTN